VQRTKEKCFSNLSEGNGLKAWLNVLGIVVAGFFTSFGILRSDKAATVWSGIRVGRALYHVCGCGCLWALSFRSLEFTLSYTPNSSGESI
jgi:hypothetical protein